MKRLALVSVIVLLACGCPTAPEPVESEKPIVEMPVDEAPVDEVPVDELPVDEVPVDEVPVDEVPAVEISAPEAPELGEGWVSLFDGENLDGWQAAENPDSFSVRDGMIVAHGPQAMLYYMGDVEDHDFKNFEFRADVRTAPGANSGIFIHTPYQDADWPTHGYEIQIDNSGPSANKTAGIYDVQNVSESVVGDDVWFTLYVSVNGSYIVTKVDGAVVAEFTEPEDYTRPEDSPDRRLSSGTFGLQCLNEESLVYFANIMVKPLPD